MVRYVHAENSKLIEGVIRKEKCAQSLRRLFLLFNDAYQLEEVKPPQHMLVSKAPFQRLLSYHVNKFDVQNCNLRQGQTVSHAWYAKVGRFEKRGKGYLALALGLQDGSRAGQAFPSFVYRGN